MGVTSTRHKGMQQTEKSLLKGSHWSHLPQSPTQQQQFEKHPDLMWKRFMCFLKLQPEAGTCRDPLQNEGWRHHFHHLFFSFSSLFSVRAIFMLSICCAPGLLQGSFYWSLVSQYLHLVSQFGGMPPRGCPSISWLRRPGGACILDSMGL